MATFKKKKIASSDELIKQQKGKPVIYVEGDSDKRIFENFWFVDFLERVSFDTVPQANGCSAVINKVGVDRKQGIRAFGLVDRDKLMADNNWSLLRETDDVTFEAARPYPEIKVTRLWELESYLIDPQVIEAYAAVADGGRPHRPIAAIEADFLSHADALIPVAALNQTLHLHRKKAVGDGFASLDCRAQVDARIRAGKIAANPVLEADYSSTIPLIEAFSGPTPCAPGEKLKRLLRIINGKGMLERLSKAFKINHDFKYFLAQNIKQAGKVPVEIEEFVQQCAN